MSSSRSNQACWAANSSRRSEAGSALWRSSRTTTSGRLWETVTRAVVTASYSPKASAPSAEAPDALSPSASPVLGPAALPSFAGSPRRMPSRPSAASWAAVHSAAVAERRRPRSTCTQGQ